MGSHSQRPDFEDGGIPSQRWMLGGGEGWLFCSVFYLRIWPSFLQKLHSRSPRPVVNLILLIFWAALWPLHTAPTRDRLPEGSEVGLLLVARQEVCVWNLVGCVHLEVFSVAFWEISGFSWWGGGGGEFPIADLLRILISWNFRFYLRP